MKYGKGRDKENKIIINKYDYSEIKKELNETWTLALKEPKSYH